MRSFIKFTRFLKVLIWPALVLLGLHLAGSHLCQTASGRQSMYELCVLALAAFVLFAGVALPLWLGYKLLKWIFPSRMIARFGIRYRETSRAVEREDYFARNRSK